MTWDPRARKAPQTIELECSRDPDTGVAACAVTYTPWNAGTRLAYEDRVRVDGSVDVLKPDGTVASEVTIGRLRLLHVTMTVTGATGVLDGFDWSDIAAVSELDEEVYDEVLETALAVQPIPGTRVRKPADRKEAGDEEDPSPAPSSTRPATRARATA